VVRVISAAGTQLRPLNTLHLNTCNTGLTWKSAKLFAYCGHENFLQLIYSSTTCESAWQKMLSPGTTFPNDAASLHLAGIERTLNKEDDEIFDSSSQ